MDAASETTVGGKEMSMEETAVLLSIQPEWCSRIFSGYKTVEIRKTRPVSLKEPFKCYIYCTKGTKFFCWKAVDHLYFDDGSHNLFDRRADGMVVGEFICDDIRRIGPEYCAVKEDIESAISGSLLTVPQVKDYAGWKSGMSYADLKDLYAWHITELKMYETPLDLAAFHLRCENALRWCNNGGCAMHIERPANGNCCGNYGLQLNRPPQSWCYVVGPSECHKELQEQVKATLNRIYPRKKVSDILPKPEILGQLAEELAEASAAASKLRRKIDGKNPTPKTLEECWEDLKKEIGDVMNSIDALTEQDPQNYHEFMSECGEYAEPKMERWLFRLSEQKEEHA